MQNDAELGFFVFVFEACLHQNIQWYSILLIKRKKRTRTVFTKKGHLTINEKETNQDAALAVSNHTSTKESSKKLQVSHIITISFNVWQKNAICILFVTFCPKAFKHGTLLLARREELGNKLCFRLTEEKNAEKNENACVKIHRLFLFFVCARNRPSVK